MEWQRSMLRSVSIKRDAALFVSMIERLLGSGHQVRFQAEGLSMLPTIRDGDTIVLAPSDRRAILPGDVVLYRQGVRAIVHRIVDVRGTQSGITLVLGGDGNQPND